MTNFLFLELQLLLGDLKTPSQDLENSQCTKVPRENICFEKSESLSKIEIPFIHKSNVLSKTFSKNQSMDYEIEDKIIFSLHVDFISTLLWALPAKTARHTIRFVP